jgi:hypothetical protein
LLLRRFRLRQAGLVHLLRAAGIGFSLFLAARFPPHTTCEAILSGNSRHDDETPERPIIANGLPLDRALIDDERHSSKKDAVPRGISRPSTSMKRDSLGD